MARPLCHKPIVFWCGEFSPVCEKYFWEKNIMSQKFPVFMRKIHQKKRNSYFKITKHCKKFPPI